jgi:predicted nucleic acid-binding Zn ribbon protein
MKRQNTQTIGEVLHELLQSDHLRPGIESARAVEEWNNVADEMTKRFTENVYVKNRVLYVKISSPMLKSNLSMQRKNLTEKLNKSVGAPVIDDIVFL